MKRFNINQKLPICYDFINTFSLSNPIRTGLIILKFDWLQIVDQSMVIKTNPVVTRLPVTVNALKKVPMQKYIEI